MRLTSESEAPFHDIERAELESFQRRVNAYLVTPERTVEIKDYPGEDAWLRTSSITRSSIEFSSREEPGRGPSSRPEGRAERETRCSPAS